MNIDKFSELLKKCDNKTGEERPLVINFEKEDVDYLLKRNLIYVYSDKIFITLKGLDGLVYLEKINKLMELTTK